METSRCCGAGGGCGRAFRVGEGGKSEESKCAYAVRDFFTTTSGLARSFRGELLGVAMLYVGNEMFGGREMPKQAVVWGWRDVWKQRVVGGGEVERRGRKELFGGGKEGDIYR